MAFTKITAAGIGTTESVTLDGLSVINNGSFGGNLTVGGVLTYEDVTNVDSVGLITARNGIVVGSGITLSKDGDIFATGITTVSGNVKVGTGITLSPDGDVFATGVVTATSYYGDGSNLSNITSTTINNNADNRLITGSGTANTLNGESNFTFDGTRFIIGASGNSWNTITRGDLTHYSGFQFNDSGATRAYLGISGASGHILSSSAQHDAVLRSESNLLFGAGGNSERVRIESDGDMGVGTGSPSARLHVSGGSGLLVERSAGSSIAGFKHSGATAMNIYFENTGSSQHPYIGSDNENLIFGTSNAEKARIEKHGTLKIDNNLSVTGIATVGSAVTISESGIEASGIGITVANINGSSTGSKNLIINGAMNVAQYDLSEGNGTKTTSSGHLCDRWKIQQGGIDENARMEHVDVGSSDTGPYEEGFRKSLKIQNGNQSSGAGAADFIELYQYIEGDQVLTSGWDYKNPNSKLTISMWVKSTIAQTFPGFFYTTSNGSSVHYMYDYVIGNGTSNLTANTWTKIKHTIPGNSNLVVTAGTGYGLGVGIFPFQGTDYTTSRSASNAWASWSSSNKVPDMTTTWYTTNNAQLFITGVQLEVGEEATPYKHKHITEEQMMCKRYYQVIAPSAADHMMFGFGRAEGNTARIGISVPVPMRAVPTVICSNNRAVKYDSTMTQSTTTPSVYNSGSVDLDSNIMTIDFGGHSSLTHNNVYIVTSDSGGSLQLSAEL